MQKRRLVIGIGFALFLATSCFLLSGFPFLPQFDFVDFVYSWNVFFELSYVVAFFACFFTAARSSKMRGSAPLAESALFCIMGALLLLCSYLAESLLPFCLSGVMFGIGYALCFVCWELVFAQGGLAETKQQIILGTALSAVPFLLFFVAGDSLLLLIVLLLMAGNFVFLFFALRMQLDNEDGGITGGSSCPIRTLLRFSWKQLLCIFLIGIIWPILGLAVQGDTLTFSQNWVLGLASNLLAAVVLGIIWLGLKRDISVENAYLVLFPLFITAFLVLPVLPESFYTFVLFLGIFGFSLFSVVMMVSCVQMSLEKDLSLVFVYSLFAGVLYGSRFLGEVMSELLQLSSLSQESLVVASSFFLLYCCSLVMFVVSSRKKTEEERNLDIGSGSMPGVGSTLDVKSVKDSSSDEAGTSDSAVTVAGDGSTVAGGVEVGLEPSGIDVLHEECVLLAAERGLTPRQTEVLDLLVHGYDVPAIAEKLYISENTVRTHTKKIYLLLDVHSKREIIDLVNERCSASAKSSNNAIADASVGAPPFSTVDFGS